MKKWKDFEQELRLTKEEERLIEIEEKIIETMINIREEKGFTQKKIAEKSGLKQPTIARLEKNNHSPQLDTLLKVLIPMGYTIEIVPITE